MSVRGRPEKQHTTRLHKPCTLPLCSASPWWNLWISTVESESVKLLWTAIWSHRQCGDLYVVRWGRGLLFCTSFLT